MVGQVSAGVRGGASVTQATQNVAVAAIKSPITAITRPKAAAREGIDPFVFVGQPGRVPVASVEIQAGTVRIPVGLEGATQAQALAARDVATQQLIEGQRTIVKLTDATDIDFTPTTLQTVASPAAVHTTPDLRPFLSPDGFVARGSEGGQFFAPTAHTRFSIKSAYGDIGGDNPIPGILMVRDPEVLEKLQSSALTKPSPTFAGTAELEAVLPTGSKVPAPTQLLKTRTADGRDLTIAIIGKPLTQTEILKMRILGTSDTVRDIFKPAFNTKQAEVSKLYDEMLDLADEAEKLTEQSKTALQRGERSNAAALEERARIAQKQADATAGRLQIAMGEQASLGRVGVYTGDQDIAAGLRTLTAPSERVSPPGVQLQEQGMTGIGREPDPAAVSTVAPPLPPSRTPAPSRAPTIAPPSVPTLAATPSIDDDFRPRELEQETQTVVRDMAEVGGDFERETVGIGGDVGSVADEFERGVEEIQTDIRSPDPLPTFDDFFGPRPPTREPRRATVEAPASIGTEAPPEEPARTAAPPPDEPITAPPPPEEPPRIGVPPPEEPVRTPPPPPGVPVRVDVPSPDTPSTVDPPPDDPRRRRTSFSLGAPQVATTRKTSVRKQPVTWKQGPVWIRIQPPYRESDISFHRSKPLGLRVRGPRNAFNTILRMGGSPAVDTFDEFAAWTTPDDEQVRV